MTDQELIKRIVSGETETFGVLIKNTEGLVSQIVYKMISDSEERKDIVQDIYIKAYQNLPKFKYRSKLSTWIGQIAYNTCLNFLKKKKMIVLDERINDDEKDPLERISDKIVSLSNDIPESWLHKKELSGILENEIEKLPPIYKTLVTLFHNQELSYVEIKQITNLPEGTIKNYLYRARKKLKNSLLLHYKKEDL